MLDAEDFFCDTIKDLFFLFQACCALTGEG